MRPACNFNLRTGQDRLIQDSSSQDRSLKDRSIQEWAIKDRSSQDRLIQYRSTWDRSSQDPGQGNYRRSSLVRIGQDMSIQDSYSHDRRVSGRCLKSLCRL